MAGPVAPGCGADVSHAELIFTSLAYSLPPLLLKRSRDFLISEREDFSLSILGSEEARKL
jgi:hypothetical protein